MGNQSAECVTWEIITERRFVNENMHAPCRLRQPRRRAAIARVAQAEVGAKPGTAWSAGGRVTRHDNRRRFGAVLHGNGLQLGQPEGRDQTLRLRRGRRRRRGRRAPWGS